MEKLLSLPKFLCILIFGNYLILINCDEPDCINSCVSDGLACSDEEGYTCNAQCRPKYGESRCFFCNFDNPYYYIDSSGNCFGGCSGSSVIIHNGIDTMECTNYDSTINLKYMGNIYFASDSCPELSTLKSGTNECKCINYYYIEKINENIKVYHCLDVTENPPDYYTFSNYNRKQFYYNKCPDNLKIIKKDNINGREVIRCNNGCLEEEYYKRIQSSEGTPFSEYDILCVNDCDSTNIIYEDELVKKCLSSCSEEGLFEKDRHCVTLENCDFYYEDKCLESCQTDGNIHDYHNSDNKKCIPQCNEGDYIYKDEAYKICYKREDCIYINEEEKKCLNSCEGFSKPEDNKCYSSCIDIPDIFGEKGKYIYEIEEHICSDVSTSCQFFYTKIDGIKKCSDENGCISKGFNFHLGKECKNEIDVQGYYKVNYNGIGSSLIECFSELNECFSNSYNYYNQDSKICWTIMPTDYYIKEKNGGKYEVVPRCQNYYYYDSVEQTNICINNCKDRNLFFFNGEKECLTECNNGVKHYYYYDPTNNECLEICKGRTNMEFSYQISSISDPPHECLSQCPSGYFYFDEDKIILPNCGSYFISSTNPKLCVKRCEPNEKVNNRQCV